MPNVQMYEAVTKKREVNLFTISLIRIHKVLKMQLVGEHGASSRGNSITDSFLLRCCS